MNLSKIAISSLLLMGLLSCGTLPQYAMNGMNLMGGASAVKIGELKPETGNGTTVRLQGKVVQQIPLAGWRMYQLQDSTGKVWVLTKRTDVRLQTAVSIEGKVYFQSIPIAGQDFGEIYVEEQQVQTPTR
jgi:RecJ-like exonuclease